MKLLLSPFTWLRLAVAIRACGFNLMALLRFAAKAYGSRPALADDQGTLSYSELFRESRTLAADLYETYGLRSRQKVVILCQNHAAFVKTVFAVSQLGADLYLLNTEMSPHQIQSLLERGHLDLLIYDDDLEPYIGAAAVRRCSIRQFLQNADTTALPRSSAGRIVLLTGGTTGSPKHAAHKPSIAQYFAPFLALLTRLRLSAYNTAYIATPMFHGYGLAMLLAMTALGKKIVISRRFSAQQACEIVREHRAEVVTVVPLMLQRMLQHSHEDLRSLRCIASGGAALNPKLVEEVSSKLGDVLYNLYGTSEGGLQIIATPRDLRHNPNVLGRRIPGVAVKVREGRFLVKRSGTWIENGDAGYRDSRGYYVLLGRSDDMIVSGGENVYPVELERLLALHPEVRDAAVIGVRDEVYGERLKAFVVCAPNSNITEDALMAWLKPRAARYQIPRVLVLVLVDSLPYTPLGKIDKKQLRT